MHRFKSMNEMWMVASRDVFERGERLESRAGPCVELVGWSGRLTDVESNVLLCPERAIDPAYACAELLWYLSGQRSVEMMCAYAPSYKRFANPQEPTGVAMGAYGHRWRCSPGFVDATEEDPDEKLSDQLHAVEELLSAKPETRQALVTMWDSGDVVHAIHGQYNDLPCTVCLQFLLRGEKLHCSAYMRSNDLWLGMPYDVFCFTSVQRILANRLGVAPGDYVHNVGSLHAYESTFSREKTFRRLQAAPVWDWPSARNGAPVSGRWVEPAKAVAAERVARKGTGTAPEIPPYGCPLTDAVAVCAAKLRGDKAPPDGVSDALRDAWVIRRAMKPQTPQA